MPFDVVIGQTVVFRRTEDLIGDGLELFSVSAGGDDEVVGEEDEGLDVEDDDVFGLFRVGDAGAGEREITGGGDRGSPL